MALDARELSRKSEKIVGAGPALVNASDANEVEELSSRASGQLVDTSTILAHLRAASLDPGALGEIDDVMTQLSEHLSLMRSAGLDGIAAADQKRRAIGETLAAYRQFGNIWGPRFADLRTQIVRLQRALTSAIAGPEERRAALDQFDQAMVALLALDQIQREAGNAFELSSRAATALEPAEIDNLQAQAQRSIRAMDGLVSDIDPDISLELFDPLRRLRSTTIGDASIFAWVRKAMAVKGESRRLLAENETLSVRLKAAVDRLVGASRGEIDSVNAEARRVQALGRDILLAVAALSLVSSFLIVWLYVGRNIVSRLTGLSSGLAAIAGGRRDVIVDTRGADEVSAMGRAVEVLRQHAIERDALLVERAEAAARLEEVIAARTVELREALEQQTAAAEVLGVINSSPGDLAPVFDTMLDKACRLCEAAFGILLTHDGERFHTARLHNVPQAYAEFLLHEPPQPAARSSMGRILRGETAVRIDDLANDRAYHEGSARRRALVDLGGARSYAAVGLRKDDKLLGTLCVYRREAGAFSDKRIALLQSFADQAVIAMENARLLDGIRAARDTAEAALSELKTAQANLIQAEKMASLGQLTAGIAHEIKNPLNFVNNFAGLSVELLDELKEAAAPAMAALGDDKRAEVDEVIGMLTSNMEKIAEHGRRADGIVKSMLEHSRGATGERRSVDINALVGEALNLAYHGARAQDQNFNITLERELDSAMAPIELVPQDITRVFLNLFGNGFYAATKRRPEAEDGSFKPMLTVTTHEFGDAVEVRVRDNGIGIPPEIKDKLFQPFFTTKPTGEGTGLGLSISYDIVTQQHGGTIEVDSRAGEFTQFTIRLPRDRQRGTVEEAA